ncbi:MAG TPA: hypothetical protein VEI06_00710 [Gemmatimonadaceae bacterium]|nr:hypothetical protein [Gemmatimonadaceae bacterium]
MSSPISLGVLCALTGLIGVAYPQIARAQFGGPTAGVALGPWVLQVLGEAGIGYEGNVLYASPSGPSDLVTRLRVGLTGTRQTDRSSLTLGAFGDAWLYRELNDLDSWGYDFSADWRYALTPRLDVRADGYLRTSLTTQVQVGNTVQPLLPLTTSHAGSVDLYGTYRLSARDTLTARLNYVDITYELPGLLDGQAGTARLTSTHAYAPTSSYGGFYEFQRSVTETIAPFTFQTLEGTWASLVAGVWVRTEAGATVVASDVLGRVSVQPVGLIELRRSVGASTIAAGDVSAHYYHTVGQALGLGRVLATHDVGASYNRGSTERLLIRVGIDQSWSTDLVDKTYEASATTVAGEARHALRPGYWIGLAAFYRRRVEGSAASSPGIMLTAGCACVQ